MRAAGLVAALVVATCGARALAAPRPAPSPSPYRTVERALIAPAGIAPGDLDLLINYRTGIPVTLPAVETLLRRPGAIDSLVPALRAALKPSRNRDLASESLWPWLGVAKPPEARRSGPENHLQIASYLGASAAMRRYLEPLSPAERKYLRAEVPGLLRASTEDTLIDPWRGEVERLRGEATTDSVMRLANRLAKDALAEAARDLDASLRHLIALARDKDHEKIQDFLRTLKEKGDIPVAIGTAGDDVHRLDRGIVFDPGGNDRYVFPDTARPGSWLLVLDVAGDDVYEARDTVGAAAGFLSAQVIADLAGDDRYAAVDFAFGSAMLGYARLFDAAGNDSYEARCAGLGFAFHGIGILHDAAGDDTYSSAYLSQGAAATGGLAVLLDDAGNDRYVSRPVYPDDLRYRDKFLSLSQGFSTGFAPRHAGGIAILWDRDGDDIYTSDIFGQGAGYWFGWGLLLDDAGDDRFKAWQYAQGAGVHFAVGSFLDGSGDDVRVSKGVSQGCGHDGGFGMLADLGGNDSTAGVDMSAGAGSANGLGVYVDLAGDDAYAMGNPRMTLGHADMRRDRGSYGFFLDARGSSKGKPRARGAKKAKSEAGTTLGRDALPPELREGEVRRVYDGERLGNGYGLDAR